MRLLQTTPRRVRSVVCQAPFSALSCDSVSGVFSCCRDCRQAQASRSRLFLRSPLQILFRPFFAATRRCKGELPTTGGLGGGRRTLKPDELAQTLFPSELKMAALSTFPVPTRLCKGIRGEPVRPAFDSHSCGSQMGCTSDRCMLRQLAISHSRPFGLPRSVDSVEATLPCHDIAGGWLRRSSLMKEKCVKGKRDGERGKYVLSDEEAREWGRRVLTIRFARWIRQQLVSV